MANDVSYFKVQGDSTRYSFNDADLETLVANEIIRSVNADADNEAAITTETARAEDVEGDLSALATDVKTSLVSAINSEVSRATTAEGVIADALVTESTRAEGVEGALASLNTTSKASLVAAINTLKAELDTLNGALYYKAGDTVTVDVPVWGYLPPSTYGGVNLEIYAVLPKSISSGLTVSCTAITSAFLYATIGYQSGNAYGLIVPSRLTTIDYTNGVDFTDYISDSGIFETNAIWVDCSKGVEAFYMVVGSARPSMPDQAQFAGWATLTLSFS